MWSAFCRFSFFLFLVSFSQFTHHSQLQRRFSDFNTAKHWICWFVYRKAAALKSEWAQKDVQRVELTVSFSSSHSERRQHPFRPRDDKHKLSVTNNPFITFMCWCVCYICKYLVSHLGSNIKLSHTPELIIDLMFYLLLFIWCIYHMWFMKENHQVWVQNSEDNKWRNLASCVFFGGKQMLLSAPSLNQESEKAADTFEHLFPEKKKIFKNRNAAKIR